MHKSVLSHEVIESLAPHPGGVFVDATFGGGGHSRQIATLIGEKGVLIATDADENVFSETTVSELRLLTNFIPVVTNFRNLGTEIAVHGGRTIDGALFDLGLSSTQLEESGRGFSFQKDEPLAMTFARNTREGDVTAETVVNQWSEDSIATILRGFGEERFARSIAKHIVEARKVERITTTKQLVEVIHQSTPSWYQRGRTHFATRTFQAIRMAVNDELGAIEAGIKGILPHMRPGGRIAVISFHSIEDRLVKQTFRTLAREGVVDLVTKKPVTPSENELAENPRARSAKLRVVEKM
ncbi:MAG: 16S rRNA (cytosine(1402)-N(4))-methyltransferase [Candidatus Lloydbacteria bacterium RIFCSPHIGHO2_01_FULL_49_22]|uniref:Ribosomal RNA small subunit methyltransferase H n=1 Tax=Candidatus Lloydbacteria bacterium RIFCSPHIGHO2_01_FULL_49_22 TaxID=1798658 RepID=A0A1G2CWK9_9BACT|nr:MAG: 16S rRNA (cytosine(1402)-N(4))-methyltransferase [Candidatus Lloydbacteria bacterium RIFCSPHIGHO2_01_FULL_49_22]OGZ09607.1 MAG: 16S rRNA (cytosine(1402)-N(4))-methyltransferase [Candidatus Lloydbacteria bacterium RIFCSPHIGHO2_02_FULL_50_18]